MADTINDDIRAEIKGLFVGDRTLGDSFAPPLLFVMVNAIWGLAPAAAVAVLAGFGVAAWRIRNGQQITYAIAGIGAVAFAAFLAVRSGRAETYFLPGIVSTFFWGAVAMISIAVRRPLAAWASWAYRRWPLRWYWRDDVRPAYALVSWIWVAYFLIRGAGSLWFFVQSQPEALAVFKSLTSWPTVLPLLVVSYRVGVTRRERLDGPNVAEFESGAPPPYKGDQRGF